MSVFTVRPQNKRYPVGLTLNAGSLEVSYLVVAGGGGGGTSGDNTGAAGGGAGGLLQGYGFSVLAENQITVGAGGTGAPAPGSVSTNGSNSIFSTIVGIGGGRGASAGKLVPTSPAGTGAYEGASGGSGGGAFYNPVTPVGYAGVPGQGNDGGDKVPGYGGGGGGGAGSVGLPNVVNVGGAGGDGLAHPISGNPVAYAQGGEGGSQSPVQGTGGGAPVTGDSNGLNGTGGGGGGASRPSGGFTVGGSGGSGIVIISYPGVQKAVGGAISQASGNTIHTFTGDGWFNINTNYSVN